MRQLYKKTNNEDLLLKVLANESPLHIRKLARLTSLNPNTVSNIAKKLEKLHILTTIKDDDTGRVLVDFARTKKAQTKKVFCNIDTLYDSGLMSDLDEHFALPTIFLFGSFAKGDNHANSDIDLFIISENKKEFDLSKYSKKLGREIQLLIHTPKEFQDLCKSSKELVNNVLNGIKLTGFIEVFE